MGCCRCRPTHPAVALVTVHKHKHGIHSAVDLQDACFGTTTVMRIAAMFAPHNIFEVCVDCHTPRTMVCGDNIERYIVQSRPDCCCSHLLSL